MAKKYSPAKGIDFKRVLDKYIKNWYIFAIAIAIAFIYAKDKNKYIEPKYSLTTALLIEDKSNKSVLEERGAISANPIYLNAKLIENQIAFLKSYNQIKKIVEELDILVTYYKKDKFIWKDIYKDSPFIVEFDKDHKQPRYKRFILKFISDDEYEISSEDYLPFSVPKHFVNGQLVEDKDYKFKVFIKPGKTFKDLSGKTFGFTINEINGLTSQYRGKTTVYIQKNTSILVVGTSGQNKQKEIDYLNTLTRVFLKSNLQKKNKILTNTISFIEGQLQQIGGDLEEVEQRLEDFRIEHKFMQLSHKAQGLLNRMNSQTKSRSNLLLDLKYYEYLYDYLNTNDHFDDMIMPSTVGLSLPLFSDLVLKLSTVVLKKEDMIANSSRLNPYIITLEEQISNMKDALKENMDGIIATTNIKLQDMEERILLTNEEFLKLPSIEREYLEIQRKYKVYNTLYDFLLRRKSEVEIQRAANLPDHEVIDEAGNTGISNISKSPKSNYINAMVWAFLLPSIFLFLLVFLNDRIMAEEDIINLTDLPIIGAVIKANPKELAKPSSYFSETLRLIRIKLGLDSSNGGKVVLITSAGLEEGKTFISENIALVYAMTGKKTLLMGFDLRRPKVHPLFKLERTTGITDFLINDLSLDDLIQPTFTKNLDVFVSGPVPPNPDELIESVKTRKMFEDLRKRYHYIIVDTSPIGLVGDAYLLNKYCDTTLFVVRHNFSKKKVVANTLYEAEQNNLSKINIVYNSVKSHEKDSNTEVYGIAAKKKPLPIRIVLKIRRIIIDILRMI